MSTNKFKGLQIPVVVYVKPDVFDSLEVIRGSIKRSTYVQDLIIKQIKNVKV
jgi:hypothetical protein